MKIKNFAVVIMGFLILAMTYRIYCQEKNNILQLLNRQEKQKNVSAPVEAAAVTQNISTQAPQIEGSISNVKNYVKGLQEENQQLQEKIGQLNSDNLNLKAALEKIIEIQDRLKTDLDTNLSTLNGIKTQVAQKESDISSLDIRRIDLENQINELNNKVLSLASANAYLEKELNQYKQEKTSLELESAKIKEELNRQLSLNETLNKRIAELSDTAGQKEKDVSILLKDLEGLRVAKGNLELELNELKLAKASADRQISDLNSRINELNAVYENAKNTILQSSDSLAKKDVKIAEMQNELAYLRQSLDKSEKEREALYFTLSSKEKGIKEFKDSGRTTDNTRKKVDVEVYPETGGSN